MKSYTHRIFCSAVIAVAFSSTAVAAPLKVVTTMATFASITKEIGGDFVEVSAVASPRFNAHFIEAKPSDVLRLKRCDLFIHAGLDLEAWRQPFVDASARADLRTSGEHVLDLSEVVSIVNQPQGPISRAQGDIHLYGNPHYWLSPENGLAIARAIGDKLAALDSEHSGYFKNAASAFEVRLQQKIDEWRQKSQMLRGKEVVAYHDEWPYLLNFLGMRGERFIEPKPGIPPSPQYLMELREFIRAKAVRLLIQATYYSQDAILSLAKDSGAAYALLCQNVGELAECSSYSEMLDYNVNKILGAYSHG